MVPVVLDRLRELCRKLKPLIGRQADALFLAYVTSETPAARLDAETLIYLFSIKYLGRTVDERSILLPPCPEDDAMGDIPLGQRLYRNTSAGTIHLRKEELTRHVGIYATTGSGKTVVGYNILLNLLKQGIPFLAIDWKRSYRGLKGLNEPLVRNIRVYTLGRESVAPLEWNPIRPPPKVHPQTWISLVVEAMYASHLAGQGVLDIFIELLDKQFGSRGFYDGEGKEYPNFFDLKADLETKQMRGRRSLWQDSTMRILRSFTLGPAASAFNARKPVALEKLLNLPVIFELDQELPKNLRTFLSEVLLRWIHLYRLGQGETDELRHVTILEEVHNLFPRTSVELQASYSLESVFREIRAFGEGLVTITQHPSLLPIFILGNTHTLIFLSLTHEADVIAARQALFLPREDEIYLDRLKVGEGIVKIKGRLGSCHVRFPLIDVPKGAVTDLSLSKDHENARLD